MVRHVVLVKIKRKVDELVTKSVCLGCTQMPEKLRVVSGRCTQPQGEFKTTDITIPIQAHANQSGTCILGSQWQFTNSSSDRVTYRAQPTLAQQW